MLQSLHIRNYVLIDSLDIDFPEGLIILSGPTGTGKSVLISALGLLQGKKADASAIAPEADSCVVEGEFEFADKALESLCLENDLDYDGGHFILRRTVAKSGRSRAFVNDVPVTLPVLEQFGSVLVDIHSQHDTLLLTSRNYQLSVLDAFAGNGKLLEKCAEAYRQVQRLDSEIKALETKLRRLEQESEYNRSLYKMLKDASIREGELEQLEIEQNQLAHSEQIKELLVEASELFNPSSDDVQGINSALQAAMRCVNRLGEYMPDFSVLSQRLESARVELKDIDEEIESANDALDCSPERLQWLDERLNLLYGLMKRFSAGSESELIAKRDELESYVCGGQQMRDQLEDLLNDRNSSYAALEAVSAELHSRREGSSAEFARLVMKDLAFMELDKATFIVELNPLADIGPSGADELSFLFSSTSARNMAPVPVSKCASGGELSRIMLSLKDVMSRFMNMPTMVFDEIDTGVSGSVADRMGSVICTMGQRMQVFAITHLPQVAAKGNAHFLASKLTEGDRTLSSIRQLTQDERVMELARMLSGESLTDAAVANAKVLLGIDSK